ncbi:hypothetical protein JHK82_052767 [Glycine max]|nr:hypothetical protein JHK82_052767 [Glycine max]
MQEKEWLSLVAIHSDAWLLTVAFYFGARFGFDKADKKPLGDNHLHFVKKWHPGHLGLPPVACKDTRWLSMHTFCYLVTQESDGTQRHLTVIRTPSFGDPKFD